MCRYAIPYKPHFACFNCRKTFKRKLLGDIKKDAKISVAAKCPECGNLMANMGLDFKSPKKSDEKSWEHLKTLFTVGVTFHSCGCVGPGLVPKTSEKLLEFLIQKRLEYVGNLRFWLSRKEAVAKKEIAEQKKETAFYSAQIPHQVRTEKGIVNTRDAVDFWNGKLAELEKNIQYVRQLSAT